VALQKTIVLDYSLLETGIRTRRQLFADRSATLVASDFEFREITITTGQQISIAGIAAFFFLKADATLQINLNNTGFNPVNDLFIMTGAIPNLVVFNASTSDVHCIICNV
jgi:hypothetical protein